MEKLTDREKEVLSLLARGDGYMHIAYLLQISTKTVRGHLYKTFPKLGVTTESEAVRWAVRHLMAKT